MQLKMEYEKSSIGGTFLVLAEMRPMVLEIEFLFVPKMLTVFYENFQVSNYFRNGK